MAVSPEQRKSARKWLNQIAKPAKRWVQMTIMISFISGLLLILQLYLLAHVAYEAYIDQASNMQLISYFIGIGIIVLLRAGLSWLKDVVSFKTAAIVKKQLREDIMQHISRLGPVKASQVSSGDLISSAMEQVEGVNNFLTHFLPQITLAGLMPLAVLVFVFPQSIVCGIILLVCAPLIPLFMIIVGLGAEAENQKHFKVLARMSSSFLDTLQGLTTLKFFNRSKAQADIIEKHSDEYRIKTMKVLKIAFLSSAVLELFAAASIALVAIYLGMGFINAGAGNDLWWSISNITLQGGLFILLLAPEFFLPLRELSTHYHAKAEAVGAALEISKILEIEPDADGAISTFDAPVQSIQLRDVSVTYTQQNTPALKHIDLDISQGQKIAVVGASGAGKTTLFNMLLKFVPVSGGNVMVNDTPFTEIQQQSWLKKISWLGQNATLFKGSIAYNLRMANPQADDNALWEALKLADLDQVVREMPQQLDTEIGEQSQGLSGGQAQRLALARAYLKPCELLFLDEPTASLDEQSERTIVESLATIWQDKTVIMLTHRLDFLAQMDQIIVLDQGEIIQRGKLSELLENKGGAFYALYVAQEVVA